MTQPSNARHLIRLLAIALALWAPGAGLAATQAAEPDIETYAAWVREASAAARRGDRVALEDAAARLASVTSVQLPDGARLAVDNRWLAEAIVAPAPDLPQIAARLGAISDALAAPPSSAPDDALARLDALLARPPFDRAEPQTPQWLVDFFDWLGRLIESLLRPIGATPPAVVDTTSWAIAIGGALLLGGVIVYLLLGLRRGLVREARAPDEADEGPISATEALDQAGALARGGDYRSAVRFLYLAALLQLDERGLLRYDRALTNREYLERADATPRLRQRLTPVVDTFDRVWYGHAPMDAAGFAEYRAQVEALREG